jgi:hypothetical protein
MLPSVVGRARIFTCDWPAELFQPGDSVQSTIDEVALCLLDGINRRPLSKHSVKDDRPLLFIASCLGGLVLIKALVSADNERSEYHHIRRATQGVIFLATPFSGTSFQRVASWAEPGLRAWASVRGKEVNTFIKMAKEPDVDLDRTVAQFTEICISRKSPVQRFTFYEKRKTRLKMPGKIVPYFYINEEMVCPNRR